MKQTRTTATRLPESQEMDRHLAAVRAELCSIVAHPLAGTETGAVIDDAVSSAGKMLRPQLLLLAGSFGSGFRDQTARLYKLAAIVELTHLASLIHDDIVDDAPTRRGRPSVQSRYGKDAAVYAGDFLLSRISYQIASSNLNRAGVILSRAIEEMCVGEIGQSMCRYRTDVTAEGYLRNIRGKTAALFMAACRMGAEETGCDRETVSRLEQLGECLGVLFQLRDDLLDFTSSEKTMGKQVHKDLLQGIYTMPVLCALEQPGGEEALLPLMEKNAKGTAADAELAQMERLVVAFGGVEATQKRIAACVQEAKRHAAALPECPSARQLLALIAKLEV